MPKCPQTQYIGETKKHALTKMLSTPLQHKQDHRNTGHAALQPTRSFSFGSQMHRNRKTTHPQPQKQTKKRNVLDDPQIENRHPSRPQHFVLISCPPPPFSLTFPVVVWSTWRVHASLVNTRACDRVTCCRLRSWVYSCVM